MAPQRALLPIVLLLGSVLLIDVHAQDPSVGGQWTGRTDWPDNGIHTILLPTGKVLFYGRDDNSRLWDPATGVFTPTARAGFNIFCTGHSLLADGRVFLAGGHIAANTGLPNSAIYDPFTDTWTQQPNMNAGRWYPTNTTLPNGDVLVISGAITPEQNNPLPQVWQTNGTWRDLTSASLILPLYPFMFLTQNGRVFNAGPQQATRYLDPSGSGTWTAVANSKFGLRDYGSAVMYEEGKILIVGGGDPPTNTAEVIDLNAATPAWRSTAPMVYPRRQNNATLLPDGKVLVSGGSGGPGFDNGKVPVLPAELWDPATERWTTLPPMPGYRGYHSIALLLPDGRVLSASGDSSYSGEIYSPAYLFKGPRPAVSSAPKTVSYGQSATISTPDAARIANVTFLRLGSPTHAFNMDQRFLRLPFSVTSGGVSVTMPANANLAPPGYYMMFLLDGNDVPSAGQIMRISNVAPPPNPTGVTVLLPADNSTLNGLNTFQAYVNGRALNTYNMFWQVDGDRLNPMADSTVGTPHKEALVDVTTWTWRGTGPYGPYLINFVAQDLNGALIGQSGPVTIWVSAGLSAPSGLTATARSSTQIDLAWSDTTTNETAFLIERCTGAGCTNFTQIAQVGANVRAYSNTGLTANTTYNYRVRATDGQTYSPYSFTAGATTSGALPAAPTSLTAAAVSATEINLSWVDNATNEINYKVERCAQGCTTFTEIALLEPNVTTYTNTGLTAGQTYSYRVRAANDGGNSAYSNIAAATTSGTLPAPGGLTATARSTTQVDLTWTETSTTETGFLIERCSGTGCTAFVQIAQTAANVTAYSDMSAAASTAYNYRVRATDGQAYSPYSNVATATTPGAPPAAPSGLTASVVSSTQITLAWQDNSTNETGYKIERCTNQGCTSFAQIAQVGANVTAYSNTGLTGGTSYSYRVRATNATGDSGYSNVASATTTAVAQPPAAPSALTATVASSTQINLAWQDNASNETGYKIERCTNQGCTSFAQIAQVGANVTAYSNTGLTGGTSYSYRVRATNATGDSGYSNVASATTTVVAQPPAAPSVLTATVASSTQINLAWQDNATNETGYKIERCTGGGCTTYAQIAQVGANVTAYSNTALTASTSYSYRVRATNATGDSGYSNVATAATPAAPPAGLVAPTGLTATAVSSSQVNLAWQDNATNETGYRIETCATSGCTGYWQIGQVGANVKTFSHTGLGPGSTYSYRVRAYNGSGNSGYSNVVETSTPGPPWTPLDFTATSGPNTGEITLRWRDTAANETGFKIERCEGSTCTGFSEVATVGANASTFVNQGLISGRVYRYRVRAYNSSGNSAYTPTVTATAR
jgi:fibronectin type 3 domain-containing protein